MQVSRYVISASCLIILAIEFSQAQVSHPASIRMETHIGDYTAEYAVKKRQLQFAYRFDEEVRVCDTGNGKLLRAFPNAEAVEFKQRNQYQFVVTRKPLRPYRPNGYFGSQVVEYGFVYGMNSKYSFELRTKPGKDEYYLFNATIFKSNAEEEAPYQIDPVMQNVNPLAHYSLYDDATRKRVLDPAQTKILGEITSGELVTLEFESTYPGLPPMRSKATFDLRCHYASRSSERSVAVAPGIIRTYGAKCEFTNKDGFAVPSKYTSTTHMAGLGKPTEFIELESTKSFERFEFVDDVPETEFTLSAFGFPEPVGVEWKKPTPRYVWWLIGVGACALIALVTRLVARRLQRNSAVTV